MKGRAIVRDGSTKSRRWVAEENGNDGLERTAVGWPRGREGAEEGGERSEAGPGRAHASELDGASDFAALFLRRVFAARSAFWAL